MTPAPTLQDLQTHFDRFYVVSVHGPDDDRALLIEQHPATENWMNTDEHCRGQVAAYIEDTWGVAALDEFVIRTVAALGLPAGDRHPAVVVRVASRDDKQEAAQDLARWYQRHVIAGRARRAPLT